MARHHLIILILATAGSFTIQQPRPGQPWIERDVCEGEGCMFTPRCAHVPVAVLAAAGDVSDTVFVAQRGDRLETFEGHLQPIDWLGNDCGAARAGAR